MCLFFYPHNANGNMWIRSRAAEIGNQLNELGRSENPELANHVITNIKMINKYMNFISNELGNSDDPMVWYKQVCRSDEIVNKANELLRK